MVLAGVPAGDGRERPGPFTRGPGPGLPRVSPSLGRQAPVRRAGASPRSRARTPHPRPFSPRKGRREMAALCRWAPAALRARRLRPPGERLAPLSPFSARTGRRKMAGLCRWASAALGARRLRPAGERPDFRGRALYVGQPVDGLSGGPSFLCFSAPEPRQKAAASDPGGVLQASRSSRGIPCVPLSPPGRGAGVRGGGLSRSCAGLAGDSPDPQPVSPAYVGRCPPNCRGRVPGWGGCGRAWRRARGLPIQAGVSLPFPSPRRGEGQG